MIAGLIACFLLLTMGGGGFALKLFDEDMEKAVKEVVTDGTRADAAAEIMKVGRQDVEDFSKRFEEITKDFREADENQSAGLDVLTPFMERAIATRKRGQTAVLDRIFELRATLTESEWRAAFATLEKEN